MFKNLLTLLRIIQTALIRFIFYNVWKISFCPIWDSNNPANWTLKNYFQNAKARFIRSNFIRKCCVKDYIQGEQPLTQRAGSVFSYYTHNSELNRDTTLDNFANISALRHLILPIPTTSKSTGLLKTILCLVW